VFSTNLSTRSCDGHAVVALRGELDLVDAVAVAAALAAAAAREPQIIVDLTGLEFIDSSGVAALARGRRQAWQAGGDLVLAAPQGEVMLVLALTRLSDAFRVYATVEEAAGERRARPGCYLPTGGPGQRTWSGLWGLPARFPRRIRAVSRPGSAR
jgi:anti-sigma B factor antagonist